MYFGNDPSAGSPTETLLRLLLPLNDQVWSSSKYARQLLPVAKLLVRLSHWTIQSVVATGGVYKGQGRNQRELMTRAYWEFLVHGEELQAPIPSTKEVQRVTRPCRARSRHDESFSVARVRPRTSKGITDLLLPSWLWLNTNSPSKKSVTIRESHDYLAG